MNTWQDLHVGHVFEPVRYVVTPQAVAAYLAAVGLSNPWFEGSSPFGAPVVPPTLITTDYSALLAQVLPPIIGMHSEHRMELRRPIPVGAEVIVTGRVEDKYVKRGRNYVVIAYEAASPAGDIYARNRIGMTIDGYRERGATGGSDG